MAKSKAKSKSRNQPFTISIHGKGIDIEASFRDDSTLGDAIGTIAERIAGRATPPFVEPATPPSNPFRDLVVAFVQTIRPDQMPGLQGALDASQQLMAMEILAAAVPNRPNGAANASDVRPSATPASA